MLAEEHRTEFHEAVASHKLRTDGARSDRPLLLTGLILMLGGVVGAFVEYQASLTQSDLRDIASTQILALVFLAVSVVGAALFAAAAVLRVLRLWLLRQLVEQRSHTDQITAALLSAQ